MAAAVSVAPTPAMASFQPSPFNGLGVFAPRNFEEEMHRFEALRRQNPKAADKEMRRGAMLVAVARGGDVEKLHLAVRSGPPPWFWFACQMFGAAAANGRTRVLKYMLVHGLPVDRPPLEDALIAMAEACDGDDGGAAVVGAARYLVTQGGLDVNRQRRKDWRTALHVACRRGLADLAAGLLDLGADANAVAAGDVMPLHCADDAERRGDALRRMLEARGARRTWRRDPPQPAKPDAKAIAAEIAAEMADMKLGDGCFDTGLAAGGAMDDLVKPIQFGPVGSAAEAPRAETP